MDRVALGTILHHTLHTSHQGKQITATLSGCCSRACDSLDNSGAEQHWLQLACRLIGIQLGYPVLKGTKKILSLLQYCVRSVTNSHQPNSSLYRRVICIASDRLGNMWLVTTIMIIITKSLSNSR